MHNEVTQTQDNSKPSEYNVATKALGLLSMASFLELSNRSAA